MKRIAQLVFLLELICFAASAASGQAQTTVTGTIKDPNGLAYSFGTVKAQVSPPGVQSPCVTTPAGDCVAIQGTVGPAPLDVNGHFTLNLYPNASISCGGQACATQWTFTVCIAPGIPPPSGTGPQCGSIAITVVGSSQDVSTVMNPVMPVLSNIVSSSVNVIGLTFAANFGVKANARHTDDATVNTGSPNITSATAAFTTADIGKQVFVVKAATKAIDGTIISVTSGTVAVASVNSSANLTNAALALGTDDTTSLVNAWTSAVNSNTALLLPPGQSIFSAMPFPHFNTATFPVPWTFVAQGQSKGSWMGIMSPDFNFGSCDVTTTCVFDEAPTRETTGSPSATQQTEVDNFQLIGLGYTFPSQASSFTLIGGPFRANDLGIFWFSPNIFMTAVSLSAEGTASRLDIQNNQGAGAGVGLLLSGQNSHVEHSIFAFNSGFNVELNNCLVNCSVEYNYFANSANGTAHPSLFITNTTGAAIEGNLLASGGTSSATVIAQVDAGSEARFTDNTISTSGATAGSTNLINAGTVYLEQNHFTTGASSTSINNSGTLFDSCGNTVDSTVTNTGSIFGNCSVTGTALVNGNVALTSGWGTGPTVTNATGSSQAMTFLVTVGTTPGANPVLTVTFPTKFWVVPSCIAVQNGGTNPPLANVLGTVTTTQLAMNFTGTATAGDTLFITINCKN